MRRLLSFCGCCAGGTARDNPAHRGGDSAHKSPAKVGNTEKQPLLRLQSANEPKVATVAQKDTRRADSVPFRLMLECDRQFIPEEASHICLSVSAACLRKSIEKPARTLARLAVPSPASTVCAVPTESVSWIVNKILLSDGEIDAGSASWEATLTFVDRNGEIWLRKKIPRCPARPARQFIKIEVNRIGKTQLVEGSGELFRQNRIQ